MQFIQCHAKDSNVFQEEINLIYGGFEDLNID